MSFHNSRIAMNDYIWAKSKIKQHHLLATFLNTLHESVFIIYPDMLLVSLNVQ